ncbi:MAG: hypothetical protein R3D68_09775 [Hyphomicrobiaceae bacterium]
MTGKFRRLASTVVGLLFLGTQAGAEDFARLRDVPAPVRQHVQSVLRSCLEYDRKAGPAMETSGIQAIDLTGKGRRAILVDNVHLCRGHMAGANCSNRGCDLRIWEQHPDGTWKLTFNEHAHDKFVSLDRDTNKFQFMAISIYAGDPRCEPDQGRDYTSGQSCDLLVTYEKGRWHWRRPR